MINRRLEGGRWTIALLFALCLAGAAQADGGVITISGEQLSHLLEQGAKLIDVRRPDEWRDTGIIAGSRLITAFDETGRFNPRFVAEISAAANRNEPLVLICRSGNRSSKAAQWLIEQGGFNQVYNLTGGIRDWLGAGKPVTPCTSC
jgi:rhodanese-related sulfurtransferase